MQPYVEIDREHNLIEDVIDSKVVAKKRVGRLRLNGLAWRACCAARSVGLTVVGPRMLQQLLLLGDFDGVRGRRVPCFSEVVESLMLVFARQA